MSKLDKLLRELCPDGVEHKKLVDAVSIERGKRVVRSQLSISGKYPVYQNSLTPLGYHTEYNYNANTTFIIVAGAAGEIGFSDKAFWAADDCFTVVCPENVLNRYIYHLLLNNQNQLVSKVRKASIPRLSRSAIENLVISLPPLEIQREIVRMLDSYTEGVVELQRQLTAELTARQKQYEFYRDKLLTFDVLRGGTINFYQRTLGELFDFRNGLSKGKEFFGKGTPFVRYTDVYNHRTLRKKDIVALVECTEDEKERLKVSRGDVLFTRTSETAEDIGWSSVMLDDMDDCVFNGFTIRATPKTKELLPEYCAYCFSTTNFRQYVTKHCAFTTRASLTGNTIAQYRMIIPPLDVQNRLVEVLDNFEKICSDLNIGLPAEIEARQKQYEYYRDKLLTFAETGNTILSRAEQSRAEQSRAEQSRALIKLLQYVFGYAVVTLEDIAENCDSMRKPVTSGKREAGEYPYYGASGIVDYVKDYIFDGDYLLVSEDGANLLARSTPIAFSISGKNWVNNHAHVLKFDCYETRRFVEFYLNSIDLAPYISGGAQPKLNQKNLNRIEIPLPSQERQKYIVDILDRFDAICNDLTSGLPAEIEARQKQYEYYRDKLLTFKEVAAT
jgi:type I restriction enzyme S subunit